MPEANFLQKPRTNENIDATRVSSETGLVQNYNGSHLGAYLMGLELLIPAAQSGDPAQIKMANSIARHAYGTSLQTYEEYLRIQFPAEAEALIAQSDKKKVKEVDELVVALRPLIDQIEQKITADEPIDPADAEKAKQLLRQIAAFFEGLGNW